MKQIITAVLLIVLFSSCSQELERVSENDFVGKWELSGRKILNGIQVSIQEENGKLIGRIVKLNDNKYVRFFTEIDDVWITEISRSSNYQFKLKEKRMGNDFFALYGLETVENYKVEFIDQSTIGLSKFGSDPRKSEIRYNKIE